MAKAKRPIIEKNFEKFINNNFDKNDRKKEESRKFEWFVNSMHIWHCSSLLYNSNSKYCKEISLETSQGSDAFFLSINNNERIFSINDNIDEVIEYIKTKGQSLTFQFIQTKYSEKAEWSAFLNLIDIPLTIFKGHEFDKSQQILIRLQDFIDKVTDEDDTELGTLKHKIEIYFYTKKDETNLESLKKDWSNNINFKIKELEYYFGSGAQNVRVELRGAEFLNTIYEKLNSNEYSLLINKNEVIEAEEKKYLIGYITAYELLNCIAPNINGNRSLYPDVFKNNIRLYLGHTKVNEKIENTLENNPLYFHHYNNGLTITTKGISDENSKNYTISPVNIVNGCQTANSIYNVLKSENETELKNVKIPIKVIVAQDKEYENITIKTNTQNGLEEKDLISITNIQKDLEEEFGKIRLMDKSFQYKRQKAHDNNNLQETDFIVQIDDLLRAIFSSIMLIPNKVSGYYDHTTTKYIDKIFDERFIKIYVIVTCLLKIVENELDDDTKYKRLKYHVVYLAYRISNRELDINSLEEYFRNKSQEEENISESEIEYQNELLNKIYSNIYSVLTNENRFKNLINYIKNKMELNYPLLFDLSDKEKEKIIYTPVQKLYKTRSKPIFENFDTVFTEDYTY